MKKRCAASGEQFEIRDSEFEFYSKLGLPAPSLSPEERQRRRIAYRNFRSLYHRPCTASKKTILSMYDESAPFPVYENSIWWSDNWNALDYGREFDFTRPFFPQYAELSSRVPRFAIMNLRSENCSFSNFTINARNCYLVFGCVDDEDCLYGHIVWGSSDCVDNLYVYRCQWCSNCVDVVDSYDLHFSTECANCTESYFLHDCRGATNCFACTNLRNKKYCFQNEQLSPSEYRAVMANILPLKTREIEKYACSLAHARRHDALFPALFGVKNEDVTGNHIYESQNLTSCFDTKRSENSKHLYTALNIDSSLDISFSSGPARFCVDCLTLTGTERVFFFSHMIADCADVSCSEFCYSSHDLFGCNGLRNAAYCILNKQYSREDYIQLRARIVEHMKRTREWGDFFPIEISPFAYNESIVSEYHPLSRQEILSRGWTWKEKVPAIRENTPAFPIAETIDQVSDEILKQVLTCETSGGQYRLTRKELQFYRKTGIPVPRKCPDARHEERMKCRTPRRMLTRNCSECGTPIRTAVSAEQSARVFCEPCYLKHMHCQNAND